MISILLSSGKSDAALAQYFETTARVIHWPETSILEPASYAPLDESLESLFGYDWLVLKNATAAEHFANRFLNRYEPAALDDIRVLAIGEATVERLSSSRIHVDLAVNDFSPAAVFSALESYVGDLPSLSRLNFLVPSANIARELFEQQLEEAGARLDTVIGYQTTREPQRLVRLRALILGGGIGFAVFTQPGMLEEIAQLFDTNDLGRLLDRVAIVGRDPETAERAACFGLQNALVPDEPTDDSLARLIVRLARETHRAA